MLLDFKIANYRSFRDEQEFSLLAGPGDEHEATHTMPVPGGDERALRAAAIYGANASGKTNLLLGLDAMRKIVVHSAVGAQRGDEIDAIRPFRFSKETREAPTRLEASFIADGTEYTYGFAASRTRVHREWLYSYPKGRKRRWFERESNPEKGEDDFEFWESMKGEKQQIATATRKNALFLSTAAQLNNDAIAPVFDWFRHRMRYLRGSDVDVFETAEMCVNAEPLKKAVGVMLESADVGIKDFTVREKRSVEKEYDSLLSEYLSQVMGEVGRPGQREPHDILFRHTEEDDEDSLLTLDEESHGTQQFFALAGPAFVALMRGATLLVDELDASLHSRMVKEVIGLFQDPSANSNGAQLIFNLHDTTPFDSNVLRRDQIWITEKYSDGRSELISLLEYAPRKDEALEKRYREGRYGGVPVPRIVQKMQMMDHGELASQQ